MNKLSVVIITFNEERNIGSCIGSVKPVADEIVVVDSLSTDQTAEVCKSLGCRVILREFTGYASQKQFAVDQALNDWILSVDADEMITSELRSEIKDMLSRDEIKESGFMIRRIFFYLGRELKHGGAGRELLLRLFDRRKGGFTQVPVHEKVEVSGPVGRLKGNMIHHSYRDLTHHLQKINIYTSRAAEGFARKGKKFSKFWVAMKFPVSFCTFYFIRLGFLDGYPGFIWSFLAAFYGSFKIAKTIEMEHTS